MDESPEQLGEVVITNCFCPSSRCCAVPMQTKYYLKPMALAGHALIMEDFTNPTNLFLALWPYRGMFGSCQDCSNVGLPRPTGVYGVDPAFK